MRYDIETCDKFIQKCRDKGYSRDATRLAIMLCCTVDANKRCGSSSNAMKKAIDLIDACENDDIFIEELGEIIL